MRRLLAGLRAVFSILFALFAMATAAHAATLADLVGTWRGELNAGGQVLPIVIHINRDGDQFSGTMDSPAQSVVGIPVADVSIDGDVFRFRVPSAAGAFEGTVNADATAIDGEWRQRGAALSLTLRRSGVEEASVPSRPVRPQEPKPPFPYTSEDVVFASHGDGAMLAGTLTRPKGDGPFAAVVLITGSGPQDRDETIFGHKPFLLIADQLARRGIATLRFDDRGVGESGGDFGSATTRDFAADAAGAAKWLHAQTYVSKVGYAGHSEGGVAAILAHDSAVKADFLVLLATPVLPYSEYVIDQVRALALIAGADPAAAEAQARIQKTIIDAALGAETPAATQAAVEAALVGLGANADAAKTQSAPFGSRWMFELLRLDPRQALAKVEAPVIGIWGGKDAQVDATKNLAAARDALADNPKADLRVIEGVNHLLQPATTGGVDEYGNIATTMAPEALDDIGEWLEIAVKD